MIFVGVNQRRAGRFGWRLRRLCVICCEPALCAWGRLLYFRKRMLNGGFRYIFYQRRTVNRAKTEFIGKLFPTGGTLFHLYPRGPLHGKARGLFVEAAILKSLLGSRLSTRQAFGIGRKRE